MQWRAGRIPFIARSHFDQAPLEIGQIRPQHGLAALDAAATAIRAALDGYVEAVVAAPQTEFAIKQAGVEFDGYPSFVARSTNTPIDDAFLMLCFNHGGIETRIVHTTLHAGLKRAIELITPERVARVIRAAHHTLKRLGIANPKIAISGLNPHEAKRACSATKK